MATLKRFILKTLIAGFCSVVYCGIIILFASATSCNTKTPKKIIIVKDTVPVLVIPAPQPISQVLSEHLYNSCKNWHDKVLRPGSFNGGMIVAKNGNIVYEEYSGNGHLNRHDAVDSLTPFHIASTSKTFTAMAVLKLWQDGKLNIDEPYSNYFPAFNYPAITIRNLLSHRSGLPNYLYFMETLGWNKDSLLHNQDVLNSLITRKAELTNIGTPNTHFAYCNTNYALLALLVEKVSGKKFPDYLQQTFFTPLHMNHSFVFNSLDTSKVNPSYDFRGRIIPLNYLDGVYGDKNVYTTPRDLLLWDRALTSNIIFSQKTLDEAYAPYSHEKGGVKNYGLGWRMNIYPNGKKTIYHNGWWHGNNAAFIRLLQDSATIIVLGNRFNKSIYHAKKLANLFGDYDRTAGEEEESESARPTGSSAPVARNNNVKRRVVHARHSHSSNKSKRKKGR